MFLHSRLQVQFSNLMSKIEAFVWIYCPRSFSPFSFFTSSTFKVDSFRNKFCGKSRKFKTTYNIAQLFIFQILIIGFRQPLHLTTAKCRHFYIPPEKKKPFKIQADIYLENIKIKNGYRRRDDAGRG